MADLCTFDSTLTTFDSTVRTFDQTTCQQVVQQQVVLVGDGMSWQDYVEAEFRKNHLQKQVRKEERKLERIEKQIAREMKKVKASEHPEGILANIFKLEQRRGDLENRIELLRVEMIPIDAFLQAEIDEDDEEVLGLL